MQYMILCFEGADAFSLRTDPAKAEAYWAGWGAYAQTLAQAGVFVSGAGLQPPAMATTVRLRDGQRHVQDGPFADVKEQLGGFFIVEAPDLDGALGWAAKAPSSTYGSTEVRPVLPPMG